MSVTTPLEEIKSYHAATKHHYHRYAASLGYMDWANQPDPFRRFSGTELVSLPLQNRDDTPLYAQLFVPGRAAAQPLNRETVGRFLENSLTVSAWKSAGGARWPLRVNPSSGNLHPTEAYLILPELEGLSPAGIYHYVPQEHGLERRAVFSEGPWAQARESGAFLVGLTSIYWREAWKYGERAFRYCQHDVGHALTALEIAARMLGWRLRLVDAIGDEALEALLGLNRPEACHDGEEEYPELLAVIETRNAEAAEVVDLDGLAASALSARWLGAANVLSLRHDSWEGITQAHHAALKPDTEPGRGAVPAVEDAPAVYEQAFTSYQVVQKRRSAVDMDGVARMTREVFYRTLSRIASSWAVVPWGPQVHVGLFVHRVDGIEPGLYFLTRTCDQLESLRSALRPEFLWQTPPSCPASLKLYCLAAGDVTGAARQLSCGQDIAGDGVFSAAMIAAFEEPLRRYGAWFYKRLFWECGRIGQLLYLEAEASGLSGTGIGCFFDDPVHEVLGLKGEAFQSLYHFTVGRAVEDPRLISAPGHARALEE